MPADSKRMRAVNALVDRTRVYEPAEAIALVKQAATAKFDETVELHLRTGLDGRHADQQIRGSVLMPHGLGRAMRVAVFAEGEAATAAVRAGADEVGGDDLIAKIAGGAPLNYDVILAQRDLMVKVGRLGRILGPKGLMPNPRANTVLEAPDLPRAIAEAKAGRVEFRLDRTNLVHCPIGKASFPPEHLLENMTRLLGAIVQSKPSGAKGEYIRAVTLTSTMGPGVPLAVAPTLALGAQSD
ncbi:MAG: 50S ribosomal protein L1 [Dehalococcoidia bacterium]|nr:50S ribosomal protein L1 [Dehalococcoidia bacterium]